MALNPDRTQLAIPSSSGIKLLDPITGLELRHFENGEAFSALDFSKDGQRLLGAGPVHGVSEWDTMTGKQLRQLQGTKDAPAGFRARVAALHPDLTRLATGSDDGAILLWDTATGQQVMSLKAFSGKITSLCFSPDGRRLAALGIE